MNGDFQDKPTLRSLGLCGCKHPQSLAYFEGALALQYFGRFLPSRGEWIQEIFFEISRTGSEVAPVKHTS